MTALDGALDALRAALEGVDNPVGAARALRRVAARHPLEYRGQREALRRAAEKALRPFFEPELRPFQGEDGVPLKAAKAVAWLALDAAWASRRTDG